MSAECPDAAQLRRFWNGSLPAAEEVLASAHVDTCSKCQSALEQFDATTDDLRELISREEFPEPDDFRSDLESLKRARIDSSLASAGTAHDLDHWLDNALSGASGYQVDTFKLLDCIGRGGMGIVFLAEDTQLERRVAVKFMAPGLLADPTAAERFQREARAAASINHLNVVTIHAVGTHRRLPYLVMEWISGESLAQRLKKGRLPHSEIVLVAKHVANALVAAHDAGVHHRDIKPANILLQSGTNIAKVSDFGLARTIHGNSITQTGLFLGTPEYIAPEQVDTRFGRVDHRSDLFSFGSVLYAMCTGRAPFTVSSPIGTINNVCHGACEPIFDIAPDTPRWIIELTEQLLQKNADDRIQSAQAIVDFLECQSGGRDQVRTVAHQDDPPISASNVGPDRFPRSRLLVTFGLIGIIALATYTVMRNLPWGPIRSTVSAGDGPGEVESKRDQMVDNRIHREFSSSEQLISFLRDDESKRGNFFGDYEEIHLVGATFQLPACTIMERKLVISAERGTRLVITPDEAGPGLTLINSDIRLEQLHVEIATSSVENEGDDQTHIYVDEGAISAIGCSFTFPAHGVCFRITNANTELTHCDLLAPGATAIQWLPEGIAQLAIENCVFVSETQLMIEPPIGAEIVLENNTFFGRTGIAFVADDVDHQQTIEARNNRFDADTLFFVVSLKRLTELPELLAWEGADNAIPDTLLTIDDPNEALREIRQPHRMGRAIVFDNTMSADAAFDFSTGRAEVVRRLHNRTFNPSDLRTDPTTNGPHIGARTTQEDDEE